MDLITGFLLAAAVYIIFCKLWPFVLYPNYLFKSRIENYHELKELAALLRNDDKLATIGNVYTYMQDTYSGYDQIWKPGHLITLLRLGDFSTHDILGKRQFLWCHTQNRLMKSILVGTGQFQESEIVIERVYLRSFFIHQWLSVRLDGAVFTIDPHCGICTYVEVR